MISSGISIQIDIYLFFFFSFTSFMQPIHDICILIMTFP